jgi:hypothetical protein
VRQPFAEEILGVAGLSDDVETGLGRASGFLCKRCG